MMAVVAVLVLFCRPYVKHIYLSHPFSLSPIFHPLPLLSSAVHVLLPFSPFRWSSSPPTTKWPPNPERDLEECCKSPSAEPWPKKQFWCILSAGNVSGSEDFGSFWADENIHMDLKQITWVNLTNHGIPYLQARFSIRKHNRTRGMLNYALVFRVVVAVVVVVVIVVDDTPIKHTALIELSCSEWLDLLCWSNECTGSFISVVASFCLWTWDSQCYHAYCDAATMVFMLLSYRTEQRRCTGLPKQLYCDVSTGCWSLELMSMAPIRLLCFIQMSCFAILLVKSFTTN